MTAQAEAGGWSSRSGELLRARVGSMAAELGRRARQLDDAADTLDVHVRAVERVAARIEAAGRLLGAAQLVAGQR